jgi:hypothetical protein
VISGDAFHLACALVDGDDGQKDAVFAEVLAVADDSVVDHVCGGVVVDADAAGGDFAGLLRLCSRSSVRTSPSSSRMTFSGTPVAMLQARRGA